MTSSQKMHLKLKCSIPFQGQWCICINKQTNQLPNTVSRHAYTLLTSNSVTNMREVLPARTTRKGGPIKMKNHRHRVYRKKTMTSYWQTGSEVVLVASPNVPLHVLRSEVRRLTSSRKKRISSPARPITCSQSATVINQLFLFSCVGLT